MSIAAFTWALRQVKGLGQIEYRLLLDLADYANDLDEAWPSWQTLAFNAECSRASVARGLKQLETYGLIERASRYYIGEDGRKHRAGTTYIVKHDLGPVRVDKPTGTLYQTSNHNPRNRTKTHGSQNETHENTRTKQSAKLHGSRIETHRQSGTKEEFHGSQNTPFHGSHLSETHRSSNPQKNPQPNPPPLNQPEPEPAQDRQAGEEGKSEKPGGRAPLPTPGPVSEGEFTRAVTTVVECLPENLHSLDRAGMVAIGELLTERLDAGWKPAEIKVLMDQPLPPRIRHLAGLVTHRLTQAVDPNLAPTKLRQTARKPASATRNDLPSDLPGQQWEIVWQTQREALRTNTELTPLERIAKVPEALAQRGLDEESFRSAWSQTAAKIPAASPSLITEIVIAGLGSRNQEGVA